MAAEANDGKFAIEVPDGEPLTRGAMVEHADYGPMVVDQIRISAFGKTVELKSELPGDTGREGIEYSGEEIRELWGETLHVDPAKIHSGETRVSLEGISLPDVDDSPTIDITVRGPDGDHVDKVAVHARDEAVRAMQALNENEHPDEVEGSPVRIDWESVVGDE